VRSSVVAIVENRGRRGLQVLLLICAVSMRSTALVVVLVNAECLHQATKATARDV
jgi:hypothetical protein